jgi:hypothetical protein
MYESWDGSLTCVQVVRVPLTVDLGLQDVQETLRQTILTKVVKSQHWLKATNVAPHDFIIFCWLPFAVPQAVVDSSEALMQCVHELDARFSLRLRVPPEVGSLFPALFACNHSVQTQRASSPSWEDVTTYTGNESSDDEDDEAFFAWDFNLDWAEVLAEGEQAEAEEGPGEDLKQDPLWDWDITWAEDHTSQPAAADRGEDEVVHNESGGGIAGVHGVLRTLWDDNG